ALAYRAVWHLAGRWEQEAAEVRKRLPPAKGPDPTMQFDKLLVALGSPNFATREAATRDLTTLLTRFPALRAPVLDAAAKPPSPEVKRRLDQALQAAARAAPTAAEVFQARVLAAAELAGTPAAREQLAVWAAGTPAMPLTTGARAALDRLKQRP